MEKVTIYDYARMCKQFRNCSLCPLNKFCATHIEVFSNDIDKANEIILNWCKEHPVETKQDRFLKMFPNADIDYGFLDICPRTIDKYSANEKECLHKTCLGCKKEYWLTEVDE